MCGLTIYSFLIFLLDNNFLVPALANIANQLIKAIIFEGFNEQLSLLDRLFVSLCLF